MDFVDQAKIYVKAGDGGAGCVSFRRERFVPRGGPDGGDGGHGGDVLLRVNTGLNTLLFFSRKRHFRAEKGRAGKGKNQHGKSGSDIVIEVPPGTVVKDSENVFVLADLTDPVTNWVAAKGGLGGKGNARFVSSTRQAPRNAQPGLPGDERWLLLELKLIGDVGLIGLPNSGKSTLLARISAARPKIADYPFTTLVPNLGVVELSDDRTMVVADIPGLIEGAHKGVGMGLDFLRHIERTKVLLYVLDASQGKESVRRSYQTIREEIEKYHAPLIEKPQAIALNKIDITDEGDREEAKEILAEEGYKIYTISALTGFGVSLLMEDLYQIVTSFTTSQK
ncbi:MAG: GTPase ObgE [Thermodesulfobacteriota bacterium]|nr:GTPase ObgE [Thermodesulfobacteriota bacterium]